MLLPLYKVTLELVTHKYIISRLTGFFKIFSAELSIKYQKQKGDFNNLIMITSITFEEIKNTPLTEEQRAELKALQDREPEPDDENPEISSEQIAEFKRIAAERKSKL
mgnify:FL=1